MQTIAITGALGHIGSKLIHSIKANQFKEVRLIDNLSSQRYCSLFSLPQNINFKFFNQDICNPTIIKYFKGVDVVVHLAAITDAETSILNKKKVMRVNFGGTKNIIKACLKHKCKLIFPSTTSVYGVQGKEVDETCPKKDLKPQSPYALSKLKAEQLLLKYSKSRKFQFVILRMGTIFGPSIGMRFHTAVNKFIWQACTGQQITVWKTAMNQKRAYLDLEDCIKAIFHIIKNNIFINDVYNLVTVNKSVAEIIRVIKNYKPKVRVKFVKSRIMNQLTYTVSSKKFKNTDFEFRGNLDKGIKDTITKLSGLKNG